MTLAGIGCLTVATISYGLLQVVDKIALSHGVNPTSYGISRVFIALALIAAIEMRKGRFRASDLFIKKHRKDFILLGALASGPGLLLQLYGMRTTSATNTSVLLALVAPLTSLFASLLLGERLSRALLLSSLLMLAGVRLIYFDNELSPFGGGDLLILSGVVGYAYTNVIAKRSMKGLSITTVTIARLGWGALTLLAVVPFLSVDFLSLMNAPSSVLVGGAIFGVRMVAYYKGIALEGAATAATFLLFSPAVAVLTARLTLNEPLTPYIVAGVMLVIAGGCVLLRVPSSSSWLSGPPPR